MVTKKRVELAESMVRSRRFAGLNLSSYRSVLDKEVEKQFAAMIFSLPELDYHQLVFRGTDIVSLAGRRIFSWPIVEKFQLIAQLLPFGLITCLISVAISLVSGHSKGGNLALYSAIQSSTCSTWANSRAFASRFSKVDETTLRKSCLPRVESQDDSYQTSRFCCRVMLYWEQAAQLVAAEGIGIFQHNALLWQVDPENREFIYVDQPTEMSQHMEGTFQE